MSKQTSKTGLSNILGSDVNPSTEDKQDDIITAIGAIGSAGLTDAELRATPVPTTAEITESLPAGTNNIGDVDVLSSALPTGASTSALQLPDGHNVTVDNASLAVTGTFWQATQPVSGTFYQATQPISAVSLPLPALASTAAKQLADNHNVVVTSAPTTAVTGTFWQATQPVSGTFYQATQPVSAAALPLPSGAATSAKQLADGHNVAVTSQPVAGADANHFHATLTSADATTATSVKAKTAAKKIHVTSLEISVGATAMEVQLQSDNVSPQVVMEENFFAINGGLTWTACDKTLPLFVVNTNEDLDIIASVAGDVTISVSGYVV